MSTAIKIYQGRFGRVALLDMDAPLVAHAHHHCHVLIKVSGADTFFSVRNNVHPLTDETAVLVNAWEPHAYQHHNPEAPRTVLLALYIEPGWLGDIQHPLSLSRHPQFFPRSSVQVSKHTRKLTDELAMEMWWSDAVSANRFEGLLFDLMISLIEPFSGRREAANLMHASRPPTDPRVRRAIAYMREHVGGEPDMDKLAEQCGLSRAHFFALFKRCTNVTPLVYSNVLRMEAAIRNLTETDALLTDIAYDVGFSAPGHFTRFFRQHLGITPSEYRRVVDIYGADAASLEI